MKTRTYFAFRIDVWDDAGNSIFEHIVGAEDFEVAVAAYFAACERWPKAKITLRQGEELVSRKALAKREQKAPESHSRRRIEGPGALLRKVGQDAELLTARPRDATPADACGRLTVNIRRRGFVPRPGMAGGACAPIGCQLDRKLRGGA